MKILYSLAHDPLRHVALEKQLLTTPCDEDLLLFYINRPSVIVGRHQRVEAEVDKGYCERQGLPIVRRLTGGGTVYHDEGNINFAYFIPKREGPFLELDLLTPMVDALASCGFHATVGARKELLIEGAKISGTAAHIVRDRMLFHGTLLHRANMQHLDLALKGDGIRLKREVASVPSVVVNLTDLQPSEESTFDFMMRLIDFFSDYYRADASQVVPPAVIPPVTE